ncbi:MAG TPA: DUF5063 domain-containing protein [Gaiellaceae bacterium]|nr:DUF5063 domain-containing protein [Gaiellaceae bacterium]
MDAVEAFAELARDYCETVDRAAELGRDLFLDTIEPKIARLYAAGAELGSPFAFKDEDGYEAPPFRDHSIHTRLSELLGHDAESSLPLEISLSVSLGDTYHDLRSGLAAFEDGHREAAAYEFAFGFREHWGYHAWEALAAIHSRRFPYHH